MVKEPIRLQRVFDRLYSAEKLVLQLSVVHARVLAVVVIGLNVLAVPAAAQSPINDIGDAMCGTGIGDLVALILAGISMYLVVKSVIRATMAFDKMGEARSETQFEGKKQLAGAGKTLAGAFVPVAFGGILEAVGMSTVSCLSFDIGLVVTPIV